MKNENRKMRINFFMDNVQNYTKILKQGTKIELNYNNKILILGFDLDKNLYFIQDQKTFATFYKMVDHLKELLNIEPSRGYYQNIIFESITLEDYTDEEFKTDNDLIKYVYSIYMDEVGKWHIPQVGEQKSAEYWLSGLPSILNVPFMNYDIRERRINATDKMYTPNSSALDHEVEHFFKNLASALIDLYYKIDKVENPELYYNICE
jgi:hypothetical protein